MLFLASEMLISGELAGPRSLCALQATLRPGMSERVAACRELCQGRGGRPQPAGADAVGDGLEFV